MPFGFPEGLLAPIDLFSSLLILHLLQSRYLQCVLVAVEEQEAVKTEELKQSSSEGHVLQRLNICLASCTICGQEHEELGVLQGTAMSEDLALLLELELIAPSANPAGRCRGRAVQWRGCHRAVLLSPGGIVGVTACGASCTTGVAACTASTGTASVVLSALVPFNIAVVSSERGSGFLT